MSALLPDFNEHVVDTIADHFLVSAQVSAAIKKFLEVITIQRAERVLVAIPKCLPRQTMRGRTFFE